MPPSSLIQRSRPTSVPSNTGGEFDATLAVLQCMPETFPGPADKKSNEFPVYYNKQLFFNIKKQQHWPDTQYQHSQM